jgi:cysteine desulfurase
MEKVEYYLDYNAHVPTSGELLAYLSKQFRVCWGNPQSAHQAGQRSSSLLHQVRVHICGLFGITSKEVYFTSGATESNHLALHQLECLLRQTKQSIPVLGWKGSHSSLRVPLERLERQYSNLHVYWLPTDPYSGFCVSTIINTLIQIYDTDPGLSVPYIFLGSSQSDLGLYTPLQELWEALDSLVQNSVYAHKLQSAHWHIDATQSWGKQPVSVWFSKKWVQSVSLSAHKLGAFPGVGVFIYHTTQELHPQFTGGPQEYNARAGTQNIIGFASLLYILERLDSTGCLPYFAVRVGKFKTALLAILEPKQEKKQLQIMNAGKYSMANCVSIVFPENDPYTHQGSDFVIMLDALGIFVGMGSACNTGKPNTVLLELGYHKKQASNLVRFSFGTSISDSWDSDILGSMEVPVLENIKQVLENF